jgi:hypothetical protein
MQRVNRTGGAIHGYSEHSGAFAIARAQECQPMLLPNRPVVMNSFTLKEAVMHHAEPKQQD